MHPHATPKVAPPAKAVNESLYQALSLPTFCVTARCIRRNMLLRVDWSLEVFGDSSRQISV
jgi:hypothetical protein